MSGPSIRLTPFWGKTLRLALLVGVVAVGFAACMTYRAWQYRCVAREAGLRGEVRRTAEGKLLYFDGECWTARPMPPTDTPF